MVALFGGLHSGPASRLLADHTRAGNYVSKSWGPRTPLCLAVSEDDGKTWKLWATVEDAPPPDDFKRVIALETGIVNDGRSEFS